jgi:hypothetical protein
MELFVPSISDEIERIARLYLRVEVLRTRNSDRLDFHDLHVAEIEAALAAACMAGAALSAAAKGQSIAE